MTPVDPDTALANLRNALTRYRAAQGWDFPDSAEAAEAGSAADDLADAAEALDGWLTGGGFLPAAWRPGAAR